MYLPDYGAIAKSVAGKIEYLAKFNPHELESMIDFIADLDDEVRLSINTEYSAILAVEATLEKDKQKGFIQVEQPDVSDIFYTPIDDFTFHMLFYLSNGKRIANAKYVESNSNTDLNKGNTTRL